MNTESNTSNNSHIYKYFNLLNMMKKTKIHIDNNISNDENKTSKVNFILKKKIY